MLVNVRIDFSETCSLELIYFSLNITAPTAKFLGDQHTRPVPSFHSSLNRLPKIVAQKSPPKNRLKK